MSGCNVSKYIIAAYACLCLHVIAKSQQLPQDTISIYLTFDDGPAPASSELICLVEEDSIKLTAFLVGLHVKTMPQGREVLTGYRANPLVEIANHSYTHAGMKYKAFYNNPAQVVLDIRQNEDSLQLTNKILRLPGRNVWRLNDRKRNDLTDAGAAADSLACLGYRIFGWDLEWQYDTTKKAYPSAQCMINRISRLANHHTTFTPGHVIILCHDWMLVNEYALSQLRLFIEAVKMRGWQFRHLGEYPATTPALMKETYLKL
jgi:peptidoglycan/xylan/chitin deacetylase (PgdA/CDA1 family)